VTTPPTPAAPDTPAGPPRVVVRRKSGHLGWYAIGAVVVAAVVVGAGAGTHWYGLTKPASSPCPSNVTLKVAGASLLNAVMSVWKADFTSATGNQIDWTASGAAAGITDLEDRIVDVAATDEPLNYSDSTAMPGTTLTLPVTGGPVVIVYNLPGYTHVLNLTAAQLAGIYLGDITNWDSTALASNNPSLPDESIIAVHRNDGAGTTWALTSLMSIYNTTWASTIGPTLLPNPWPAPTGSHTIGETGNSALAKEVNATNYSIGYVDLPDAINDDLLTAGILNEAGDYVQPTIAATQAAVAALAGQSIPSASGNWSAVSWVNAPGATSYPIAALSEFIVLQEPSLGYTPNATAAEVLVSWLHWVLTTGQSQATTVDYIDPPSDIVTQDLAALGTMTYDGASIPTCP
jgi:phosphate transport system substrate-binding protein